jgi:hypothetical protein
MSFVTYAERKGFAEGMKKGLLKGIALSLDVKFGRAGRKLLPRIRDIDDVKLLAVIDELTASVLPDQSKARTPHQPSTQCSPVRYPIPNRRARSRWA